MEQGADVTSPDNFAICAASNNGYLDVVKYLVEHGAVISSQDNYAVRAASENGHLDVVKYLVEHGADVTAEHNLALMNACYNGHFEVVKYLLAHGADATFNHSRAVYYAKHIGIVYLLAEHGADISCLQAVNREKVERYLRLVYKGKTKAANKIGRWWIPICYDMKRACGQRMAERNYRAFEGLVGQ